MGGAKYARDQCKARSTRAEHCTGTNRVMLRVDLSKDDMFHPKCVIVLRYIARARLCK